MSLKNPEQRILGKWQIEKAYVNGSDRTADIDTIDIEYYHFYIFDPRGMNHQSYGIPYGMGHLNHTYTFINDKSEIVLSKDAANNSSNGIVPCFILGDDETWTILRLTDKEMWLELENQGTLYETRFIKTSSPRN